MNIGLAIMGAVVAAIPVVIAGYLFGVRRGVAARDALRSELSRLEAEQAIAKEELLRNQGLLLQAQQELAARSPSTSTSGPMKEQIDSSLKSLLQPLLTRDLHVRELSKTVSGLLGPIVERERLGLELARLDPSLSTRGALSQLLSAVAKRAGFSTVLITDDNGLPMAQSEGAKQIEMLCATLGLLLNMVDRISSNSGSHPLAVVLRDADNQVSLHRLFKVEGQRYVLTAIASGGFLPPDILDPVLARIERALIGKSPG
jgi:hypothetical protein